MPNRDRRVSVRARHAGLGVLVAVALAWSQPAHACSCVQPQPPRVSFGESGSVFEGRVVSLEHAPQLHRITARLEVLRRWKGAPGKTVDAVTIDEGSNCGFAFAQGRSYLIYASESQGPVSVNLCSRTRASDAAASDFAALNALVRPVTPTRSSEGDAAPTPSPPPLAAPSHAVAVGPVASSNTPPPDHPAGAPAPRGGCTGCSTARSPGPDVGGLIAVALAWATRRRAPKRQRD